MPKQNFWKVWLLSFLNLLDTSFSRVAIFLTLATSLGLQIAGTAYAWLGYVLVGFFVIGIIFWTKPKSVPNPNLTGHIDFEALNDALVDTPRIGLVGLEDSGKTTFLDAAVARVPANRRTERPYGQFVLVPDTDPEAHVVLVDSVGGNHAIQFAVQSLAMKLIFFVDHAAGSGEASADKARVDRHIEFARQLTNSATESGGVIDKVIIVANKSDLWQSDEKSSAVISHMLDRIQGIFASASPYRVVSCIVPYSNNSRYDIANLVKEAAE